MSVENPPAQPIKRVAGTGVPLRGDDVDTDQILPGRFLKEVSFDNMGEYAFYDARRDEDGELNDHPLNTYVGANICVVNHNFGCGSSREHAPQGLMRWGVEAMVGESFAEIFADNCKSLGIPCATADRETIEELQSFIEEHPEATMELNVAEERLTYDGTAIDVDIDETTRDALLQGIYDKTSVMLANVDRTVDVANSLPYVDG